MRFVSSFSVAYFLHFALAARRGGFREDEMLNMWIYWRAGAFKSLMANITFWTTFYRPAGALYYLPLYHFFRLDPLPYRIVQISILAAAIPIASLSGSTSSFFPLRCFSGGSWSVLPCGAGEVGVRWGLHLRCVMRLFLPRGIDLLRPSA